ncbi:unnamed protein product, partial [Tetraodon nigroviridis]
LPKVPVPPLKQTLDTYLKCVQHLVDEDQFLKTKAVVEKFRTPGGAGETLQKKLLERRDKMDNWVYEYWLEDMYLNNRLALPVNSSPAMVFPQQTFKDQSDALRFAAHVIGGALEYKALIDARALPVEYARGQLAGTPMCMEQYYRLFTSYRYPGLKSDALKVQTNASSSAPQHIVVACKNQFFVLDVVANSKQLNEAEILCQLEKIGKMAENAEERLPPVGVLTSDGRTEWAQARDALTKDQTNRDSLALIETCLCVVCLDGPSGLEPRDSNRASLLLHGGGSKKNGANRWYDKSLQFVIGRDGACGVLCEHSPFEGIVMVHCSEYVMKTHVRETEHFAASMNLFRARTWKRCNYCYSAERGACQKRPGRPASEICRLPEGCSGKRTLKSRRSYQRLKTDWTDATGGWCPPTRARPFDVSKRVGWTTFRSATPQALAFVKSMTDGRSAFSVSHFSHFDPKMQSNSHIASHHTGLEGAEKHIFQAITGMAIDNHLLGLLRTAKELNMEKPDLFCDETYLTSNQFILSTSQVPTTMEMFCCYGPVVSNGYGACYNPQSDHIVFCVSSFWENTATSSAVFVKVLNEALLEIRDLCITINGSAAKMADDSQQASRPQRS